MFEKELQDLVGRIHCVSVRGKGLKLERRSKTARLVSVARFRLFPTRT